MIAMLTCQQVFINGALLFFVIIFVGMFFCPFPQSALYKKGQKKMPTKIIIKHTSYYNLRKRGLGAKSISMCGFSMTHSWEELRGFKVEEFMLFDEKICKV